MLITDTFLVFKSNHRRVSCKLSILDLEASKKDDVTDKLDINDKKDVVVKNESTENELPGVIKREKSESAEATTTSAVGEGSKRNDVAPVLDVNYSPDSSKVFIS